MNAEINPQPVDLPSYSHPSRTGNIRRTRNQVACDACHTRRVRCDMVYSAPCSRCRSKDTDCAIRRTRKKRGRRGKSERIDAMQTYEVFGLHDTPTIKEEETAAAQTQRNPTDQSSPPTCPIDTVIEDEVIHPISPETDKSDDCTSSYTDDSRSTSSSQILEELGMGITESWVSPADSSTNPLELGSEDERAILSLLDGQTADDLTQLADQIPPSMLSFPSSDLSAQSCESISRSDDTYDDGWTGVLLDSLDAPLLEDGLSASWLMAMSGETTDFLASKSYFPPSVYSVHEQIGK